MTKEEGVILSAYTGYLLVNDFGAVLCGRTNSPIRRSRKKSGGNAS